MTTTRYLSILAIQEPTPFMVDGVARNAFTQNFNAQAAHPVDKFEEDIYNILMEANVVTGLGQDVFIDPNAVIPTGNGPYTTIFRTSGLSPLETHNGDKYERLSVQIVTRAKSYVTARNKAIAIWRALDGQRNREVTSA